uniref:Uncharacterized protein n=1 Tax=viral metagenome TaxID=1070528 RepID=A0A6C0AIF8_9ZZZZ
MLATPKDIQASVVVIALYAFTAIVGIPRVVLDVFVAHAMFGRIVWLSAIVYLLYHKLYLTAVFLVVLGIRITFDADMSYAFSHDGILAKYAALQKNDPRFDSSSELDLKMANETLSYDPARWLDPGRSPIPLLLFPPTPEQLSMIGNNGK